MKFRKALCFLFDHRWHVTGTTPHHDLYTTHETCLVCGDKKTNFTPEPKSTALTSFILTVIAAVIGGLWHANWDETDFKSISIGFTAVMVLTYLFRWAGAFLYIWIIKLCLEKQHKTN